MDIHNVEITMRIRKCKHGQRVFALPTE